MKKSEIRDETSSFTVLDPRGWEPQVEFQGINARPEALDGKKIVVVNLHGGNEEIMESIASDLQNTLPACHVEYYPVKGRWADLKPEDWEVMLSGDAAILGHNY